MEICIYTDRTTTNIFLTGSSSNISTPRVQRRDIRQLVVGEGQRGLRPVQPLEVRVGSTLAKPSWSRRKAATSRSTAWLSYPPVPGDPGAVVSSSYLMTVTCSPPRLPVSSSAPPRPLCAVTSRVPNAMAAAASAMSSRTPRAWRPATILLSDRSACSAPAGATVLKHGEDLFWRRGGHAGVSRSGGGVAVCSRWSLSSSGLSSCATEWRRQCRPRTSGRSTSWK
jgi:hypothetical protein